MNVLITGSGGREHAFAWKIAQSPLLKDLYCAPGNAGTKDIAKNLLVDAMDFDEVKNCIIKYGIDLVVVGPEAPLVAGLTDYLRDCDFGRKVLVLGPSEQGAQLEGSKDFAKDFMIRHGIPTAAYQSFTAGALSEGEVFLESLKPPYVLKADGLAAGKGVVIAEQLTEAKEELKAMLEGKFGKASSRVVIEEFLKGIELSVFVLTDGNSYIMLPEAKDYKRIGESDTGLNTGGMGAVSPVPFADKEFMQKLEERIVVPTIEGIKKDGIDYRGFVFIGLMNVDGDPYVIEYNVRMGDPETEVVLPRIDEDLLPYLRDAANGSLKAGPIQVSPLHATTIMLVSGGYPGKYETGKSITGIRKQNEYLVFHAGTKMEADHLVTAGGRVIAVTALGKSMGEALGNSNKGASEIAFQNKYYRRDIGFDLK